MTPGAWQADHVRRETRARPLLYLQLFNGHALIEQPSGRAVEAWRGGHGQLGGQGDERTHVHHSGVGRRAQQRQVLLTGSQERTESLEDSRQDSHGD